MKQWLVVVIALLALGGGQKGFSQNKIPIICITGFQGGVTLLVMCHPKEGKDNSDFFVKLDKVTIERIGSEAKTIPNAKLWSIADKILFFDPAKGIELETFATQIQAVLNKCAPKYDFTVQLPPKKA